MEVKEPKYKIGDKIKSLTGFNGKVHDLYFNEVSKEWIYVMEKDFKPFATFKESNLQNDI